LEAASSQTDPILSGIFYLVLAIIDFILQKQGNSLQAALSEWRSRSDNNCLSDYSFHMAVTDFNEETKKGEA